MFPHLQRFNVYINKKEDFLSLNALTASTVEEILHIHVPSELYFLLDEVNVKYKVHVYFNGAKSLDKIKNVPDGHDIVLYIESSVNLKQLSVPNPKVTIHPLYCNNIEFLKQGVFLLK